MVLLRASGSDLKRPLSEIPLDVWRHYQVVDWPRGVAVADTGEKLFSVHAKARPQPYANLQLSTEPVSRPGPKSTVAKEQACFRHLVQQMRSRPDDPIRKEDAWKEASEHFPGVSRKGFDRAWARAIEDTQAFAWRKPGSRTPKSVSVS